MEISLEKRERIIKELGANLEENGIGDMLSFDQVIEFVLRSAYSVGYSDGIESVCGESMGRNKSEDGPTN